MKAVNKIPIGAWVGIAFGTSCILTTPPAIVNPANQLVSVVAAIPRIRKICPKKYIVDMGIHPATFGKIKQATGKQKWNKK